MTLDEGEIQLIRRKIIKKLYFIFLEIIHSPIKHQITNPQKRKMLTLARNINLYFADDIDHLEKSSIPILCSLDTIQHFKNN